MVGLGRIATSEDLELRPCHTIATTAPQAEDIEAPRRQISEDRDARAWKKDGSNGHYHSKASLFLVMWAQILYIISLVIIIPTAARYASSLGAKSSIYFGLIVGISSIVDPLVSRLWSSVIAITSLHAVLLTNACINMTCSLMYILASCAGDTAGIPLLLASRCILGFGSVQTAYLQYLGRAVSIQKVTFAHFLTTASISYGFAFGICLAFGLSLAASYCGWSQNLAPGWFTMLLWFLYIPLHCLVFVEPDKQAGIVDPESKIRLTKEMRPKFRREPFSGLVPCLIAIFVIGVVKGAFEVMTIDVTKHVWHWDVMKSALFLGVVMFVVALTTIPAYMMQKRVGESRIFFYGLTAAMLLLPAFFVPVSEDLHDFLNSALGVFFYTLISVVTLSLFNIGRAIAFSLTTELPSPHWRDYFLANASSLFTMGRGAGPIVVGALTEKYNTLFVLIVGCIVAVICVAVPYTRGDLEHSEHEVGPARAEPVEDVQQQIVDRWLEWNGLQDVLDLAIKDYSSDSMMNKPDGIDLVSGSPNGSRDRHKEEIETCRQNLEENEEAAAAYESIAWVFD
jgi:MFS family permease